MPSSVTPQELARVLDQSLIFDMRRKAVFESATDVIPGALWRNPEEVGVWGVALPRGTAVVVYCVHGHGVSQSVASQLEKLGFDAGYLASGIEAWRQSGSDLATRPDSTKG